jgi:hypothetical protein
MLIIVYPRQLVLMPVKTAQRRLLYAQLVLIRLKSEGPVAQNARQERTTTL